MPLDARLHRRLLMLPSMALLTILTLLFTGSQDEMQIPSSAAGAQPVAVTKHIASSLIRAPTLAQSSKPTQVGHPTRLRIPAIQVDAAIEDVGLLADGELDTPQQQPYTDVGWYTSGPRPGERGSAVIDGHLNQPGGDAAVFHDLHKLQPGDQVFVDESSGQTHHFQVYKVAAYPPRKAPLQAIFGNTSGQYLNLLTCAGVWIPEEQQTTLRMIVFTSLV